MHVRFGGEFNNLPCLRKIIKILSYKDYLKKISESDEKYQDKLSNIEELILAIESCEDVFYNNISKEDLKNGIKFNISYIVSQFSLESPSDINNSNKSDYISLMTLHNTKGLEFNNVFITGVMPGLFPSKITLGQYETYNNIKVIEEERRLLYVGITRAMKSCYLSANIYDYDHQAYEHDFINEIDNDFIIKTHQSNNKIY